MEKKVHRWSKIVFCFYCFGMLWLLFGREVKSAWSYNLVPFQTIRLFLRCFQPPFRPHLVRMGLVNLLGNVLLFVPLGYGLPLMVSWIDRLWKVILTAFCIMATVELLQMLLLVGTFDVDDLMLNLLGIAAGYGLMKIQKS